ncbi:MAG: hypothetical protein JWO98_4529 [Frankiales bacterium]|nr:hypothetical protein [Frankiales bacterium]
MATELDEALTAAGVPALVQKVIDPMLLEYQRRYSPFIRVTPTKKISSTTYYFNRRTNRAPGGFVSDGGARPMGNSVYEQFQFAIKQLQSVGGVTGFAQEVTRDQIGDLRAQEIASCMQGLLWDIETAMIWGSAGATVNGPWPQFDGLDVMVNQFASTVSNPQNAIDAGGSALATGLLDQLVDMVETNAAMPIFNDQWMFVASPTAISRLAQVEQVFQRYLGQTEIAAGLNVPTYRDIPLVKSSFLAGRLGGSMPAVTTASATFTGGGAVATGSIATGSSYYYIVEPVMARAGVGGASAAVQGKDGGNANRLIFGDVYGPEGARPISYRVYRGASGTTTTLRGIVDAVVTTAADGISPIWATGIIDTGTTLIPVAGASGEIQPPNPVGSYVGGGAVPPRVTGGEDIFLVPRDADILVRPYVRDVVPLTVYPTVTSPDQLPFALATDTTLALRAPKFVGRLRNVVSTLSSTNPVQLTQAVS